MQVAGGRGLVRKVSMEPKFKSKKRGKQAAKMPPLGLQRYLATRGTANGVHEFTRTTVTGFFVNNSGITMGVSTNNQFRIIFGLASNDFLNGAGGTLNVGIPGAAELSALFDEIKLDRVEVWFKARNDSSANTAGASNTCIQIASAIDNNDSTVPATSADIQQYATYKVDAIQPGGREHYRTLRPKFQQLVSYTVGTNSSEGKTGYLRSDIDVPHYALKCTAFGPTNSAFVDVVIKSHFKCKLTK